MSSQRERLLERHVEAAALFVVGDGIDPPTSGFSDPYQLFHYISVRAGTSRELGFLTPSETY